jgi:hypothetical protein
MKKIDEQNCISMPTVGFSPDPMTRWVYLEPPQSATYFPDFVSTLGGRAFAAHWGCFDAEEGEPSERESAHNATAGQSALAMRESEIHFRPRASIGGSRRSAAALHLL